MMRDYFKSIIYLLVTLGISWVHAGPREDFFQALSVDNGSALSTLFLRGQNPNEPDAKGQTALVLALRDGHERSLKQLLDHPDIRIDLANASGETPLMMAALKGRLDAMRLLLGRGATLQRTGWTPLHYAATAPVADAAQLLVERGAVIDAPSPNGTTPLMMASRYGLEATARWLLSRGADPRIRNEQGLSAADFARHVERTALADTLAAAAAAR